MFGSRVLAVPGTVVCRCAVGTYTVSQKKPAQNCFYQNFVKFLPVSILFGRMMAKRL